MQINVFEPPWSMLLGCDLPLGAIENWTPSYILALRGSCHGARKPEDTTEFFEAVLVIGLGVRLHSSRKLPLNVLFGTCCRVFAERRLIFELPRGVPTVLMGLVCPTRLDSVR